MTDDDWFERALREDEGDGEDEAEEAPESPTVESPDRDPNDAEGPQIGGSGGFEDAPEFGDADELGAGDFSGEQAEPGGFGETDADPGGFGTAESPSDEVDTASGSSGGGFADADSYDTDEDDEDDGLFEEDFASAFQNAPGGGGGGVDTGGPSDGGFGGDADFGTDAGGGFGGGFGGGQPFESEAFDDEEFESSIPRIDVGIEGLDSMIQGGVPERSLITTIGSAGTGKTTFGLQFLHEALQQGDSAVFITLEESHGRIVNTATEKGWKFDEYEEEGRLAIIDIDPIEMANSLTSIRNDLPRLIEEFGASRLVLDSVSLLEMMYDDQATRRNEVYDFTKSLKKAGVTTMLTSEASEDNPYASRHGIIEYLVDAVFILRYVRSTDDFTETRLAVEIQKIRDANHSREIKPYSITNEGISVYRQANIF